MVFPYDILSRIILFVFDVKSLRHWARTCKYTLQVVMKLPMEHFIHFDNRFPTIKQILHGYRCDACNSNVIVTYRLGRFECINCIHDFERVTDRATLRLLTEVCAPFENTNTFRRNSFKGFNKCFTINGIADATREELDAARLEGMQWKALVEKHELIKQRNYMFHNEIFALYNDIAIRTQRHLLHKYIVCIERIPIQSFSELVYITPRRRMDQPKPTFGKVDSLAAEVWQDVISTPCKECHLKLERMFEKEYERLRPTYIDRWYKFNEWPNPTRGKECFSDLMLVAEKKRMTDFLYEWFKHMNILGVIGRALCGADSWEMKNNELVFFKNDKATHIVHVTNEVYTEKNYWPKTFIKKLKPEWNKGHRTLEIKGIEVTIRNGKVML